MGISFQGVAALPYDGLVNMLDPSVMKRTDVLYSGLEIENKYDHPMVAILSDSIASKRLLAVSVASDQVVQISAPVGQYGMQVLVGSNWVNLQTGFSDGENISVVGGISIKAGLTTFIQLYGSGLQKCSPRIVSAANGRVRHVQQLYKILSSENLSLLISKC